MPSDAPMPADGVTLMDPHTSKTNQCSNKNSKKVSGAKETMSIFYGHAQRPHRCCHFCLRHKCSGGDSVLWERGAEPQEARSS